MPTYQISIPTPHQAQQQILREAKRFNVLACGRRFGKSLLGRFLGTETLLEKAPVGWWAPTYKDLAEIWRDFKVAIGEAGHPLEQEKRLEISGMGAIDFWSMEDPDSGRGRRYKRVIIDEAAKAAKFGHAWGQTIRPTLADFKGDAWFLSTPKGRDAFWQLFQRGQDLLQPDWMSWQMPTRANPFIDPREIADAKRDSTEREFKQEWLAEFIEDGGAVFRYLDKAKGAIQQDRAHPNHTYVIGCDWAQTEDFSVFTVIDCTTREVVFLDRDNRVDYLFQINRLRAICERFQPDIVVSERTGNLALADFLRRATYREVRTDQRANQQTERTVSLPIHDFNTTNESKAEIVQALALAFERQEIKIPDDSRLIGELEAFTSERLPSGRIRYAAPEGLHDDMVMSLCMAWWRAKRISQAERYSPEDQVRIKLVADGYTPGQPQSSVYAEMRMNMLAQKYDREARKPLVYGIGAEESDDDEFIDGNARGF